MIQNNRRRISTVITLGGVMALTSCTSIRSTIYDADNYSGCERQEKKLHGVPITIDVPTHVKITISETRFYDIPKVVDGVTIVKQNEITPVRQASYDLIAWKELYTVDFKRPMAGIMDLKLTFDEKTSGGQYFNKIQHDVTDVTIDKVAALVQQLIASTPTFASLGKGKSAGDPVVPRTGLTEVTSIVACEVFEIRQPDLEGRIQEFLNLYVNNCTPPCSASLPCPASTSPVVTLPPIK